MSDLIRIDGSMGEGGGQVLRTSLALSLITGRKIRIENIRAKRSKPGLLRQHLTAVQAAARIGSAYAEGAELGSGVLNFEPGPVAAGTYEFAVGTAGSASLVFQTIFPALMLAEGASRIRVEGGTHNKAAPPFDFLAKAFLPLMNRMGVQASAELIRPGFFPAGGGEFVVSMHGGAPPGRLELRERGRMLSRAGRALLSRLPEHIGRRELDALQEALDWPPNAFRVENVEGARGPGNVVLLEIESENATEVFAGFGAKGISAEEVARAAAREASEYLDSGAAVGEHLADQLLLPLSLGAGGSFTTTEPSPHTRTNIEVIKMFLEVDIRLEQVEERRWFVSVAGS